MRTLVKFIRNLLVGFLAVYLLAFGATLLIHYPEPVAVIRLGLAPASKTPTLMPFHVVQASSTPAVWDVQKEPIPKSVDWNGASIDWATFLAKTSTNAFLIIRNGVITYEWYNKSTTAKSKLPSYSVAKTLTSIMIGQLISAGKISESDTFVKYFPQYKTGGDFDKVTIQSLLDMQAGVGVTDNYPSGPSGWGVGIAQMYATTDLDFFMQHNRKMSWAPGTKSEYRSVDTQMLGFIIKKVTGMRVSDYFSKSVWQPIGAADGAYWNVDHVGGLEKTFCCFNATARDYARIGELFINDSSNVISHDWLKRLTHPVTVLDHSWGYGAQVWHPFTGVTMLLGLHGQYVYVYPATNTVIVKLSDEPTDSGNDEVLTVGVLQSLVAARL